LSTQLEGDAATAAPAKKEQILVELEALKKETFLERHRDKLIGATTVITFLSLWEWAASSGFITPLFISSPIRIARAFGRLAESGVLANDIIVSAQEFLLGYGLALIIGVPVGMAIGWYRLVSAGVAPFTTSLYATPKIALMPLMIVWLGIGIWSKVAVIFLACLFPYLINMQTAMRTLDPDLLKAARSFGASQLSIFIKIALPSSVPFLISAMRLALGHGLIGVVVGEMYGASAGIGYRIIYSGASFKTDDIFVGVMVLVFAGLTLNAVLLNVERRFSVWRPAR
jgi:NitT/TauT family transport system permease protein